MAASTAAAAVPKAATVVTDKKVDDFRCKEKSCGYAARDKYNLDRHIQRWHTPVPSGGKPTRRRKRSRSTHAASSSATIVDSKMTYSEWNSYRILEYLRRKADGGGQLKATAETGRRLKASEWKTLAESDCDTLTSEQHAVATPPESNERETWQQSNRQKEADRLRAVLECKEPAAAAAAAAAVVSGIDPLILDDGKMKDEERKRMYAIALPFYSVMNATGDDKENAIAIKRDLLEEESARRQAYTPKPLSEILVEVNAEFDAIDDIDVDEETGDAYVTNKHKKTKKKK